MQKFNNIVLFVVLCVAATVFAQREPRPQWCTTPDRQRGSCTRLQSCPSLRRLVDLLHANNAQGESALDLSQQISHRMAAIQIRSLLSQSQCRTGTDTYCCPIIFSTTERPTEVTTQKYKKVTTVKPSETTTQNLKKTSLIDFVKKHPNHNLVFNGCGDMGSQDMIAGGTTASLGQHPWLVRLEFATQRGRSVLCSGVLINKRYVLTSAQCLQHQPSAKLVNIILGEHDIRTDPDCEATMTGNYCADPVRRVQAESMIPHPQFRTSRHKHFDIGLVRLTENIESTGYISPICLPHGDFQLTSTFDGHQVIAGWGTTQEGKSSNLKLVATVHIMNNTDCRKIWPQANLAESQVCAGGDEGVASCSGDSGGPLMAVEDDIWFLSGIVSMGPTRCGSKGLPGIYTRVTSFLPWLLDNIRP